jgi:hypothetical protein
MPEQQVTRQYDVHLFAVVRFKVAGVQAESHQEAVKSALSQTDLYALCSNGTGDYAEELAHYAVDVVGDEEFIQSRWYYSQQSPLMANLVRLVTWYDRGRPEAELDQILCDARDTLANSI